MKILLILGHPKKGSLNHAIAMASVETLESNGHQVIFHDLYAEAFDPLLTGEEIPKAAPVNAVIKRHCEELASADGIVVIHPNWWGQPPAILKGWIDRVIRPGVAYGFKEGDKGEGVPVGLLKAKTAIVFNTSNTAKAREKRVFGDPLETIWKNCIFGLCGIENFHRETYGVVVTSTPEERQSWLNDVKRRVACVFPPTDK